MFLDERLLSPILANTVCKDELLLVACTQILD